MIRKPRRLTPGGAPAEKGRTAAEPSLDSPSLLEAIDRRSNRRLQVGCWSRGKPFRRADAVDAALTLRWLPLAPSPPPRAAAALR